MNKTSIAVAMFIASGLVGCGKSGGTGGERSLKATRVVGVASKSVRSAENTGATLRVSGANAVVRSAGKTMTLPIGAGVCSSEESISAEGAPPSVSIENESPINWPSDVDLSEIYKDAKPIMPEIDIEPDHLIQIIDDGNCAKVEGDDVLVIGGAEMIVFEP